MTQLSINLNDAGYTRKDLKFERRTKIIFLVYGIVGLLIAAML